MFLRLISSLLNNIREHNTPIIRLKQGWGIVRSFVSLSFFAQFWAGKLVLSSLLKSIAKTWPKFYTLKLPVYDKKLYICRSICGI
jgi:hypothetical protein